MHMYMSGGDVKAKIACAAISLCLMIIACPTWASTANVRHKHTEIMELLRVMGMASLPKEMAPLISAQFVASLRHSDPSFSDRGVAATKELVRVYLSDPARAGQFMQQLVPIYDHEFTATEIQQLIVFYKTPLGRKLAASMFTIDAESAQVGRAWAAEILPGLRNMVLSRLRSEGLLSH